MADSKPTIQKRADEVRVGDRVLMADGKLTRTVSSVSKGPFTRKSVMLTYCEGGFSSQDVAAVVEVLA